MIMNKSVPCLIFFLLVYLVDRGQDSLRWRTIRSGESKEFSFPVFNDTGNNVRKINRLLQLSELELLKGFGEKNMFEHVSSGIGGIYGSKTNIEFQIKKNTSRILSIGFQEASSGMTTHYWVRYYNFNPANGDRIHLKDLFTEKGYTAFRRYATGKRTRELRRQKAYDSTLADIAECYGDDDLEDFFIAGSTLYIDGDNCVRKPEKFVGLETMSRFRLAEFGGWLNAYGRAVFGLSDDNVGQYRSRALPQLFSGKIGARPVWMLVRPGYGDEIEAEYVDLRVGRGIYMEGKAQKGWFDMTELTRAGDTTGLLKAHFDGWTIQGTYRRVADRGKNYPVLLERQ